MSNYSTFINEFIASLSIPKRPANLYDPIRYTLAQGGKRLRPELCLIACHTLGGNPKQALYPAVALELLHNFTLIHDDIMDEAPLRRGKPTVYTKWNSNIAILSGDALFAIAMQTLGKADTKHLPELIALFTRTAVEVCEGQQYDLNYETGDVSETQYMEMIRLKTAVLLAACLKAGAIVAGASEQNQQRMYDFGINVGLAFQLEDDLLDVYSDAETFGKINGGDIKENKRTYLSINALLQAQGEEKQKLQYYFSGTDFDFEEKYNAVKNIYNKLGIRQQTERKIEEYTQKAVRLLDEVEVAADLKMPLRNLAEKLMQRTK